MRAAIAIGSNSTRLLCADAGPKGLTHCVRGREETRLFLGLTPEGNIAPERLEATAQAVLRLQRQALSAGAAADIALFATSACRDAKNGDALARRIKELTGLKLQIISGEEEARLAFRAVAGMERRLVMDIGGGSTEFTWGEQGAIALARSAQMGASRLLRMQPIASMAEAEKAMALAENALRPIADALRTLPPAPMLMGLGGTCSTAAAMAMGREAHGEEVEGAVVTVEMARRQLGLLAPMPLAQRRQVPGLPPSRAEHMPHGLCILLTALRLCGMDRLTVSGKTNLDGYLLEQAGAR